MPEKYFEFLGSRLTIMSKTEKIIGAIKNKTFLKKVYRKVFKAVVERPFSKIVYYSHVKENRILLDNFGGRGFGDNPGYIAKSLHEIAPELEMVWLVDNFLDDDFPSYITPVPIDSIKGLYMRASSRVWIDNIRHLHPVRKKKGQLYLQTWHAPFSPKCVEKDAQDRLGDKYVKQAKYDGTITDGILANSKLQENQYRRAFWLGKNAEILRFGLPRNDVLARCKNNKEAQKIARQKLKMREDTFYVLYAPTFRDDYSTKGYEIDFEKVKNAFQCTQKKNCKIIIRLHPNAAFQKKKINYSEDVIDGTDYPNMQELSIACDAVISDYSTSIFDFALLEKPAFICALDLYDYEKKRGLLTEFYKFPFPMARSSKELISIIEHFDSSEYNKKVNNYFSKYPIYDSGNAAKLTAEWILKKINMNIQNCMENS